jgi:hypothetical protein
MSGSDPLAAYLDRPVEDAAYAHPVLALGPGQWLVVGAGMKELLAQGLPPGRVWTLEELRGLPWPAPPTLRDVLRFFAPDDPA